MIDMPETYEGLYESIAEDSVKTAIKRIERTRDKFEREKMATSKKRREKSKKTKKTQATPTLTALQRIASLEKVSEALTTNVVKVVTQFNEIVAKKDKEIENLNTTVSALVELTGEDKVRDKVRELCIAKLEKDSEVQKEQIDSLLKKGDLLPADEVASESLICITEKNADGSQTYPQKGYVYFNTLTKGLKESLSGKKVGDSVAAEGGGTIKILSIFKGNPNKDTEGKNGLEKQEK